jgi:hypothetical protein
MASKSSHFRIISELSEHRFHSSTNAITRKITEAGVAAMEGEPASENFSGTGAPFETAKGIPVSDLYRGYVCRLHPKQ